MVDHAPLPYVTPAFIAALRKQGKDRDVYGCAKAQARLLEVKADLEKLAFEASTSERKALFERMVFDVNLALAASEEFALAVKAGR